MFTRWTIDSPLSARELADRVRNLRRWSPARDGFSDRTHFIDERFEVDIRDDGFRFVFPGGKTMCQGRFRPTEYGTQVDVTLWPRRIFALIYGTFIGGLLASSVVLLVIWPDTMLPALIPFIVGVFLGGLLYTASWVAVRIIRRRLTFALTLPGEQPSDEPR